MLMLRAGRVKDAAPPAPLLMVLGASGSGKSSLLSASRLVAQPPPSAPAPTFAYAELIDGDEVLNRAGVWEARAGLEEITSSLRPPAAIVLVLDGSRPWELGASLTALISKLPSALPSPHPPPEPLRTRFLSYREPGAPLVDASGLELPAGVLEHNYGIPVVITVTKSDVFSSVAKELDYKDAHWDFIQTWLRRIALRYGAALAFCSARKELNTGLLGDYIRHLLFGTPFSHTAQLQDRETLFVPIGWDSSAKIAIDFANQKITSDPALPFEDAIRRPAIANTTAVSEGIVSAEDDQAFLSTQLTIMGHSAARSPGDAPTSSPLPATADNVTDIPRTPVKEPTKAAPPQPSTPLSVSPLSSSPVASASPAANDHAVLSNFFNSLINKTASPVVRKSDITK